MKYHISFGSIPEHPALPFLSPSVFFLLCLDITSSREDFISISCHCLTHCLHFQSTFSSSLCILSQSLIASSSSAWKKIWVQLIFELINHSRLRMATMIRSPNRANASRIERLLKSPRFLSSAKIAQLKFIVCFIEELVKLCLCCWLQFKQVFFNTCARHRESGVRFLVWYSMQFPVENSVSSRAKLNDEFLFWRYGYCHLPSR